MDVEFAVWDWKEQPDWQTIDEVVSRMSNGKVRLTLVEENSDMYILAISNGPISQPEALVAFAEESQGDS